MGLLLLGRLVGFGQEGDILGDLLVIARVRFRRPFPRSRQHASFEAFALKIGVEIDEAIVVTDLRNVPVALAQSHAERPLVIDFGTTGSHLFDDFSERRAFLNFAGIALPAFQRLLSVELIGLNRDASTT